MSTWAFRTIICPAAQVSLAQMLFEAAAEGDAGKGMLTTPLSPTGGLPATHYVSSGGIYSEFADLLPLTTIEQIDDAPVESTRPGQVETVEAMCAAKGITLPAGTIGALFSALDVTDVEQIDTFAAMARLGLQMVQEVGA